MGSMARQKIRRQSASMAASPATKIENQKQTRNNSKQHATQANVAIKPFCNVVQQTLNVVQRTTTTFREDR